MIIFSYYKQSFVPKLFKLKSKRKNKKQKHARSANVMEAEPGSQCRPHSLGRCS